MDELNMEGLDTSGLADGLYDGLDLYDKDMKEAEESLKESAELDTSGLDLSSLDKPKAPDIDVDALDLPPLPDIGADLDLPPINAIKGTGEGNPSAAEEKKEAAPAAPKSTGTNVKDFELPPLPDKKPVLNEPEVLIRKDSEDESSFVKEDITAQEPEPSEEPQAEVEEYDYDLDSIDVSNLISDMDGNSLDVQADIKNFNPNKIVVSEENRVHAHAAQAEAEERRRQAEAAAKFAEMQQQARNIQAQHGQIPASYGSTPSYTPSAPSQPMSSPDMSKPQSAGAYNPTGNNGNATGQYTSSLDQLYESRFKQDYELAEKGKKKVEILTLIGFVIYGIDFISSLFSVFGGRGGILDLLFDGALLFLLYRLRLGSDKARDILGKLVVFDLFWGLIHLGGVFLGGAMLAGLMGPIAVIYVLIALANIAVDGYLAFQLFADESITEYTKSMRGL